MFIQMYEEKYMRFPEGRSKALTFSYDDGVSTDKRLLEIFSKYGLKGTFNLNSELFDCQCWHGRMGEEETYNAYKDSGQEIALHGARHVFLGKVPLPEAIREIIYNRVYLEGKFGRIVNGMAYAYSSYNADILRALKDAGVVYARTTDSTHSFALPEDWLQWHPTCHHGDRELPALLDKFLSSSPEEQFKKREPWLFYIWGHSYEYADNGNWDIIENLGRKVAGREDVWLATNMEIYSYVQAFKNLVFSCDGERVFNPSFMPVWIEIRGKVYKIAPGGEVAFEVPV